MSAASLPRPQSRMHPAVRSALGALPSAPVRLAPGRRPAPVVTVPRRPDPASVSPVAASAFPVTASAVPVAASAATIDCDSCPVRSWSACSGCVVAVLIGFPPGVEPARAAAGFRRPLRSATTSVAVPAAGQRVRGRTNDLINDPMSEPAQELANVRLDDLIDDPIDDPTNDPADEPAGIRRRCADRAAAARPQRLLPR